MGTKLMEYYKEITDRLGMTGKIKLAQATKIPSAKAATEPDTAENIAAFERAYEDLTGVSPSKKR